MLGQFKFELFARWTKKLQLFTWQTNEICYSQNMKKNFYIAKTPNFTMEFPAPTMRESLNDAMRFAEQMVSDKVPVTIFRDGNIIWTQQIFSWQIQSVCYHKTMKNECGKTRPKDNPYEIWRNGSGWEWRILKRYQSPDKEKANPFARVFCFVTSPFCESGEYGDTYIKDITGNAVKVS